MATEPKSTSHIEVVYKLTTEEFAAEHRVRPQTVRKRYAATGTYCGVAPLRLPNRRLLWPTNTVARLVAQAFGSEGKA